MTHRSNFWRFRLLLMGRLVPSFFFPPILHTYNYSGSHSIMELIVAVIASA